LLVFYNEIDKVVPILESNTLCPNNQANCIDEGVHNNQIVCVPCNKLIAFVPIVNRKRMPASDTGQLLINDPNFEDLLWLSLLNKTEVHESSLKMSLLVLKKEQIYVGVVPNYFKVENFISPFICSDTQVSIIIHNYYFKFVVPIMIVFMMILIMLSLDVYFKYKAKEFLSKYRILFLRKGQI
jgi:hypothetical protein